MDITVRDLLTAPLFRHSEVLAGTKGLDNKISSVTILDSPDGYRYLKGGELVITNAYNLLNNEAIQTVLVDHLAAQKAAALGISLRFFNNDLSPSIRERAELANFPIITISENCRYSDILAFIMDYLMCRETKEFMRKEEVYHLFLQCVASEGFPGLARLLYQWTGLPAAITFEQEQYQHPYDFLPEDFPINQHSWCRRLFSQGHNSPNTVWVYSSCPGGPHPDWIGIELNYKGQHKGHVLLWSGNRSFEKSDSILLGFAATACKMEIQRIIAVRAEQQKYKSHYLDQLFRGYFASYQDAAGRAEDLGWELPEEAVVILIRAMDSSVNIMPTLNQILLSQGHRELIAYMLNQQEIIFITSPEIVSSNFVEKLCAKLNNEYANVHFLAGIGRPAPYHQLGKSLKEAEQAIRISANIKDRPPINYFEELGVYRLIAMTEIEEEVYQYHQDYLAPLISYDLINNTELAQTLKCFLENSCNYRKTAKDLYVHPNTIRYRIQLAEKIIKLDLEDPDNRFNLQLAFRISPLILNFHDNTYVAKKTI